MSDNKNKGDWQEINYLDHARGDTNPTRQRGDRRRPALASASVPRSHHGVGMAGLLCPDIDAIARNRSILG